MNDAANKPTTVTTPSDTEVRIERELDAPRELVWEAYTDPVVTGSFDSRVSRDAILEAGMERGVREGYEKLDELLARQRG